MKISRKAIENIQAEKQLTGTQIAARAGVTRQNISAILRRGTCHPATAGKLAQALGVAVIEILDEQPIP